MLYRTFFKSYTEKVWGVPCREISAEWGAQRIKGLSILKSLKHALGKLFGRQDGRPGAEIDRDVAHRTLLVSQVRPRPDVGNRGRAKSSPAAAQIITGADVQRLYVDGDHVTHVEIDDAATGETDASTAATTFSPPCRSRS